MRRADVMEAWEATGDQRDSLQVACSHHLFWSSRQLDAWSFWISRFRCSEPLYVPPQWMALPFHPWRAGRLRGQLKS